MTDPRDLIKRLADSLHEAAGEVEGWGNYASSYFQEKHDLRGNVARIYAEAAEARAYLAQPEPEGPTDEEIEREAIANADTDDEYRAFKNGAFFVQEHMNRAVLARWGSPPQ